MQGLTEKRGWQPREMQMVSEWLVKTQQGKRWHTRVRLGSPSPAVPRPEMSLEEQAMIGGRRRWADAVILTPELVTIVEAAIRCEPGDISILELYGRLFRHTPEFEPWASVPLSLLLLYAIEDPATILMAREKGISCVEYKPLWLDGYLQILQQRERRGHKKEEI